jgi:hypothetical protein
MSQQQAGNLRPEPWVDSDTVRALARYAGIDISDDDLAAHTDFLRAHARAVRAWDRWPLALQLEDGHIRFVAPLSTDELLRAPYSGGSRVKA